jgi:hypothetical protein
MYGEIDYTSAGPVLDSPTSRPETDPVVGLMGAAAQTGLAFQWTPTYRFGVSGMASHIVTTSDDEIASGTTTTVGGDVDQSWELDARSSLSVPTAYRYYFVEETPDWQSASSGVSYRRALSLRTTMDVHGGATAALQDGTNWQALPRVIFSLEHVLATTRTSRVANRYSFGTDATYDPLVARIYPIARVEGSISTELGETWRLVGTLAAYTPLTREPISPSGVDSMGSAAVSAVHRFSEGLDLEFGSRFETRANHLSAGELGLRDTELWGFARLTVVFDVASTPVESGESP